MEGIFHSFTDSLMQSLHRISEGQRYIIFRNSSSSEVQQNNDVRPTHFSGGPPCQQHLRKAVSEHREPWREIHCVLMIDRRCGPQRPGDHILQLAHSTAVDIFPRRDAGLGRIVATVQFSEPGGIMRFWNEALISCASAVWEPHAL